MGSNMNNRSIYLLLFFFYANVGKAQVSPGRSSPKLYGSKICICDLTEEYCDLNCCCDKDCSPEDRLIFSYCTEEFRYYDTRFCDYTKHTYVNKTAHELQVNQDSLFCVARSNLPASYVVQKKEPLKSFADAENERFGYNWPTPSQKTVVEYIMKNYSFGEPLWIIRNKSLDNLFVFKGFLSTSCLIKEEMQYLVDDKTTCTTTISEDNPLLKAETYFKNFTIIAAPGLFNHSFYKINNNFTDCLRNSCLTISPKFCDNFLEKCSKLPRIHTTCRLSISTKTYNCFNIVEKIKYIFRHDGRNGIKNAEVLFSQKNISLDFDESNFQQTFEVQFLWFNHSLNYSSYLSGNPGYLIGRPVLISNLISENILVNDTKNKNITFIQNLRIYRVPSDFTSNFMVLPDNDHGRCVFNNKMYLPVEFGYNMYANCNLMETIAIKNSSATTVCRMLQKTIFKFWSIISTNNTLSNRLIGQFGNANANQKEDWSRVLHRIDLNDILVKVKGSFENNLFCMNITNLLKINIYHSRVDFDGVLNQEKILATTFDFGNFRNIPFDVSENTVSFSLNIINQVMFYDITSEKIKKLVDLPKLDVKLPHDFFYPFIRLNNGCSRLNGQTPNLLSVKFFILMIVISYLMS